MGLIPAPLLTQAHELTSHSPAGKWSLAHLLSQTAAGKEEEVLFSASLFLRSTDSWSLPSRGCLGATWIALHICHSHVQLHLAEPARSQASYI